MSLTRLAVKRPLAVLMGLLALVLMGGVSYTYLNVDRLPPITIGVISVSDSWPNASPTSVEQLVTEPLENALSGVAGVQTITSTSSQGSASITLTLADGYDPTQALADAEQALSSVGRKLPTDATTPVVRKFDPNASPIMDIAFTGAAQDTLYNIATNSIQPELESLPGVGSVGISGGLQQEVDVRVDYSQLAAYNLTVQQISTALVAANVSNPAGSVPQGSQTINIVPQGQFQTLQDIQDVVVASTPSGGAVQLKDVATVEQGDAQQTSYQRLNGQPAVGLSITANTDANTVQVADEVKADLQHLQTELPQGTSVTVVNDQSIFTRASLDSIQHDLAIAIVLVAIVILTFLHEWRHTVIVLCAIPTSLISTFLVMYALGFTLNTMSMMALALMIGILVDDSIVVLENIHRHLQLGDNPWQAALNGRGEIGMAAIAITMADVVVYTPIAFMSGSIGQLFRQYGLTVVAATLFSMLISFTLTPMLASRWLKHTHPTPGGKISLVRRAIQKWDNGFEHLSVFVSHSVPLVVKARWVVILVAAAMVAGVGSLVPLHVLGVEYAPAEDDNSMNLNLTLPAGTSLAATDDAAKQLEGYVQKLPEVQYYFTTVSAGGGGGFGGASSRVSMSVQTVDKSQRSRTVFDLINVLRKQAAQIPGARFGGGVSSPLPGGGGGGSGGVSLQVSGPDQSTLNQVTGQIQDVISAVPGVADVNNNNNSSLPEVDIHLNENEMAQLGVTNQQVDSALSTTVGGTDVTQFQPTGTVAQNIVLEATDTDRYNLSTLGQIPVAVASGSSSGSSSGTSSSSGTGSSASSSSTTSSGVVTLGQIATLTDGTGPVTIQRVNRSLTVTISATAVGRPLGDVARDVQNAVSTIPLPPGYTITIAGQVQFLNQAISALVSALVLSAILEYMLLVALYESFLFPLVRMLTVPLGMIGAFLLLWVTGNTINIFSMIGMIMGEGLVAKSGILLVDYTNQLREQGWGRTEALKEAARVRLRPILMTSATMILGMLPLALKLEEGAETRSPMAIVVIGALLSSTVLTLGVVPALYTVFDDLQTRFTGRKRGEHRTEEDQVFVPEPAPALVGALANGSGGVATLEPGGPYPGTNGNGYGNGHAGNGRGVANGYGAGTGVGRRRPE